MVDRHCDLANHIAQQLVSAEAELLAPVGLNQMLFSFGDDETTDKVIAVVQREGTCWVGGTTWKGRRAMRINICDTSTTIADIDRAAAAIANEIKLA